MPEEEPKEISYYPEDYHDITDSNYRRSFNEYRELVFENEKQDLSQVRHEILEGNSEERLMRHYHRMNHFLPTDDGGQIKDDLIQYDWDWQEKKIFGGIDGFFADGSQILDLGSGMAIAHHEITRLYKEVRCFGVDYRYHRERPFYIRKPEGGVKLTGGHFANLPFGDESFDRVLSVETFPSWPTKKINLALRYFKEITRVSKIGTIWRGTLPPPFEDNSHRRPIVSHNELVSGFTANGWEVVEFLGDHHFIARLIKNTKK